MNSVFIGLGAMGYPMASHLHKTYPTRVWNRTLQKAEQHSQEHGTTLLQDFADLGSAEVIFSCLPTTREVQEVVTHALPHLSAGTVWIDCTSGDPVQSLEVARQLAGRGVTYLDAPVSGGTAGAIKGALSVMVGGDPEVLEKVQPVLATFAAKVVRVGDVGAGHAVKAVNNMLLAINLLAAGEGLTALAKLGTVDVPAALDVINASSGRSNVTQNLLPERVLTRAFPATFALGLLAKDAGIALDIARSAGAPTPLFAITDSLYRAARDTIGATEDHTAVVKLLEGWAGVEIK